MKSRKRSPSKLDAEDGQDLSVLDVLAVFTVWDEEFNDEFEDIVNEVDNETEDLAKETTVCKVILKSNTLKNWQ